jgi:hypothetical protein
MIILLVVIRWPLQTVMAGASASVGVGMSLRRKEVRSVRGQ